MALKNTIRVKDKYIPVILGAVGILLCSIWVLATSPLVTLQDWGLALFAGLTQGILTAGVSTYVDQLVKQLKKAE